MRATEIPIKGYLDLFFHREIASGETCAFR